MTSLCQLYGFGLAEACKPFRSGSTRRICKLIPLFMNANHEYTQCTVCSEYFNTSQATTSKDTIRIKLHTGSVSEQSCDILHLTLYVAVRTGRNDSVGTDSLQPEGDQHHLRLSQDMEIKPANFMTSLYMQRCFVWIAA
jgi:hypothetical protein